MHTYIYIYIYIYNAQEEVEMKFSCIIKLKRRKKNVVYVNGGCVITVVSI